MNDVVRFWLGYGCVLGVRKLLNIRHVLVMLPEDMMAVKNMLFDCTGLGILFLHELGSCVFQCHSGVSHYIERGVL
ncbi:hypothetical protein B738_21515 [Photorhabdus temperata subsp. temperata M1021]|nr:hypothetical protein B738_21515 [Photorhabdus temperata subsp. temperata M1021]